MASRRIVYVRLEDVGLCNCARCDCECIGEMTQKAMDDSASDRDMHWPWKVMEMPRVAGRLWGRPYCSDCYRGILVNAEHLNQHNTARLTAVSNGR